MNDRNFLVILSVSSTYTSLHACVLHTGLLNYRTCLSFEGKNMYIVHDLGRGDE